MKSLLKLILPKQIYSYLQKRRREYLEQHFFEKRFRAVKCGNFEIQAPRDHILFKLQKIQPYRDLFIGISSKFIAAKYPNKTIIDIGANIGDTAAIIASYCQNKLILVEASDYYYDILTGNISNFSNETITKKCLISDGGSVSGSLHHWKGTASFQEKPESKNQIKTERLSDIGDNNTCLIKIDTDGFDFKIILSSISWLSTVHPAIVFENHIGKLEDLNDSNELFSKLINIGYLYFIIWDDAGLHMASTASIQVIQDLNHYLLKMWDNKASVVKGIYNFDVLCLHKDEEDIYNDISEWYRTN